MKTVDFKGLVRGSKDILFPEYGRILTDEHFDNIFMAQFEERSREKLTRAKNIARKKSARSEH